MTLSIDALSQYLRNDVQNLSTLETILIEEQDALRSRNIQSLQDVVKRKTDTLSLIEASSKAKTKLFEKLNTPITPKRMAALIRASRRKDLIDLWEDAEQRMQNCKHINQVNGKVMEHSRRRVAKLMDIFRGQSQQSGIYTAQGKQQHSGAGGYTLAKA
ncbi:FlgN family protein [Oleiphilus messinensis]|uniref:FlgN family protein n=1 Tax=Oleiphilus messinensis TaxID=141451 RepID=A0A1Y0IDJ2_9GAMM|nr:flagellar protein FlgN [Oleiphilus messinensis]ARU57453.1 FlgN family protein [Oleiphilus messinensis]